MLEIYLGLVMTALILGVALIVINSIRIQSQAKVTVIIEETLDESAIFAAKIIRDRFFPNAEIYITCENGEKGNV